MTGRGSTLEVDHVAAAQLDWTIPDHITLTDGNGGGPPPNLGDKTVTLQAKATAPSAAVGDDTIEVVATPVNADDPGDTAKVEVRT